MVARQPKSAILLLNVRGYSVGPVILLAQVYWKAPVHCGIQYPRDLVRAAVSPVVWPSVTVNDCVRLLRVVHCCVSVVIRTLQSNHGCMHEKTKHTIHSLSSAISANAFVNLCWKKTYNCTQSGGKKCSCELLVWKFNLGGLFCLFLTLQCFDDWFQEVFPGAHIMLLSVALN